MEHPKQIHWRYALLGFLAALGIMAMPSCSSSKPEPGGGHIEYPVNSAIPPAPPPSPPLPPPSTPMPQTSASWPFRTPPATTWMVPPPWQPPYPPRKPPYPSEILEKEHGIKLLPADKLIADVCPARPWSENVPLRECTDNEMCGDSTCQRLSCGARCTDDSQCGDGYCDRGECKPIWSCNTGFGLRCQKNEQCDGLCIQGRCRSCISHAECVKKLDQAEGICTYSTTYHISYCRNRLDFDFSGPAIKLGPVPSASTPSPSTSSPTPPPQKP